MIAIIDNYDSFTYNLVQYFRQLISDVRVFRNDAISVDALAVMKPSGIVISPGPGCPDTAGISLTVIHRFFEKVPILGVCLGHQAIAQAFGGKVVPAARLVHGKTSWIHHDGSPLYKNLDNPFEATRYHSLIVDRDNFPACLTVSAWTLDDEIMGVRHQRYRVEGVQFHPESILTNGGFQIIQNFVQLINKEEKRDENNNCQARQTGEPDGRGDGTGHGNHHDGASDTGANRCIHDRHEDQGGDCRGDRRGCQDDTGPCDPGQRPQPL